MKTSIINILLTTILLLSSQFTSAQAPGFLGKKTSIYYTYSAATPGVLGKAVPYNYSTKKPKSAANYIQGYHQATLEYAVSRNRSLNVHYFMYQGGYGSELAYSQDVEFHQDPLFSQNYKARSIGISTKKYYVSLNGYRTDDGGIAPIGRYIEPKFFVTFVTDEKRTDDGTVTFSKQRMHYGGSITWGRHTIIGKNIILNVGMEIGYVHHNNDDKEDNAYQDNFALASNNVLRVALSSYEDIVKHHIFAFHIGIGYPLF